MKTFDQRPRHAPGVMGIRFLKIAAIYLAIGVSMGLYMGITQTFKLHPVHAHVNLLGWASMALFGVIYVQFPSAAETTLARIHFWMHNLALPVFMVALTFLLSGHAEMALAVEIAATVTGVGIALFVINLCLNVRIPARADVSVGRGAPTWPAVQ
jgi:hypothetical protein